VDGAVMAPAEHRQVRERGRPAVGPVAALAGHDPEEHEQQEHGRHREPDALDGQAESAERAEHDEDDGPSTLRERARVGGVGTPRGETREPTERHQPEERRGGERHEPGSRTVDATEPEPPRSDDRGPGERGQERARHELTRAAAHRHRWAAR